MSGNVIFINLNHPSYCSYHYNCLDVRSRISLIFMAVVVHTRDGFHGQKIIPKPPSQFHNGDLAALVRSGAHELPKAAKEHATRFHDNPNYVSLFQQFSDFFKYDFNNEAKYFPCMKTIQR